MTDEQQLRRPRRKTPDGIRLSVFVVILLVGLAVAFIPLESVSEVNSRGGAARYCKVESFVQPTYTRGSAKSGMIQCVDGKPDYFPPLPLYIVGGLIALIGTVGAIERTVKVVRARFAA